MAHDRPVCVRECCLRSNQKAGRRPGALLAGEGEGINNSAGAVPYHRIIFPRSAMKPSALRASA